MILLDAQMPPDSGLELATELEPSDRENTIIMLTSDDFPDGPRVARATGCRLSPAETRLREPSYSTPLLVSRPALNRCQGAAIGAGPPREEHVRGLRILLAEDSEENRLLIAEYLRGTPHQLDTAENGRVAIEMFTTRRYGLVLVDLNMPVLDGFSAVASMRAWERSTSYPTPIVALTGRAMVEDRVRSIEAGCNGHLTKPIRRAVLMEAISQFTKALPAE